MNPANLAGLRPSKIHRRHLDRWAIVYVRQSHPQQVQQHRESAEVQANLRQLAAAWGWPVERIRVLDGDQGRSGTTTAGRDDFDWLMTKIALNHVGLVLSFQMNRLAREDEACCRLIRVCGIFDTLLADQDGLYHPHDVNDRLLLTLKGFMGGFELHQLQQRMQAGRLNRAARRMAGPGAAGLHRRTKPQIAVRSRRASAAGDPLGFRAIDRVGQRLRRPALSAAAADPVAVPSRRRPLRGQLQWCRPRRETLRLLLRRPAYAGASLGVEWRSIPNAPARSDSSGNPRIARCSCPTITPPTFRGSNIKTTCDGSNKNEGAGPRPGPGRTTTATLAGLIECGHCGCRMQTRYTKALRYDCQRWPWMAMGPLVRASSASRWSNWWPPKFCWW